MEQVINFCGLLKKMQYHQISGLPQLVFCEKAVRKTFFSGKMICYTWKPENTYPNFAGISSCSLTSFLVF